MRDLPDAANVPICFCGNVPVGHSLAYALNKMERLISYTNELDPGNDKKAVFVVRQPFAMQWGFPPFWLCQL